MQLLRHLVTVTCVLAHQAPELLIQTPPPPCACSITTLVYIACPTVWGSCCRLSCYVFVCFGNGFQVAIVAYVTWWLMGKIHLLLIPPQPLPWAQSQPCMPSKMNTQREEQVPSYSPDKVTHWHPDARFFEPAGRAFKSSRRPLWKQGWICVAMTV